MHIGEIDGYEVTYDDSNDTLTCKGVTVRAERLLKAWGSTVDKEEVENTGMSELIMRKGTAAVILGCFNLTIENSKQLIKKIKHVRIKSKAK